MGAWQTFGQLQRVDMHTTGENAELDDKIFDSIPVPFLLCKVQAGPQTSLVLKFFIYHVGISKLLLSISCNHGQKQMRECRPNTV